MKLIFVTFFLILTTHYATHSKYEDVAPNPINAKGIYTTDSCEIQMVSEFVYADLYLDSAKVVCTFNLLNFGSEIDIQIGFPEMNFQYWTISKYSKNDKKNFKIYVDGHMLTESDIQVPPEMENIYKRYQSVDFYDSLFRKKQDSIYDAIKISLDNEGNIINSEDFKKPLQQLNAWRESKPQLFPKLWNEFKEQQAKGNFPWYVWNVHFDSQEMKQIKVEYTLPSGIAYGKNYRYFKYILETGKGWFKSIEKAEIQVKIHDVNIRNIENLAPQNYTFDPTNNTYKWLFYNLEPTKEDDIYIQYYNSSERKAWNKELKNRKRKLSY